MDQESFVQNLTSLGVNPVKIVVAGISGGPDSLSMLHLLFSAGYETLAVHVNHHLRAEADAEAKVVADYCLSLGIKFVLRECDVKDHSRRLKRSLEEAARILRYQILFAEARLVNAQAVLVGHNADDQVETILMHLLRGSGLSGLRGMSRRSIQPQWDPAIPLLRPLLETPRKEILDYCQVHGLKPNHDESNKDPKYTRNRIRLELMPNLATYNPQIVSRLLRMTEVLSAEDDLIDGLAEQAYRSALRREAAGFIVFDRNRLKTNPSAIVRRVVKKALQRLAPTDRDIDFTVIDNARTFLQSPTRLKHLDLLEGVEILLNGGSEIILAEKTNQLNEIWPQLEQDLSDTPLLNGETSINRFWEIHVSNVPRPTSFSNDPYECILDADKTGPLMLTRFRPGDRFKPFGLKGRVVKLGDYWTTNGLSARARAAWPVLRDLAGEIAWVPGYQIGFDFQVDEGTRCFLRLRLIAKKTVSL